MKKIIYLLTITSMFSVAAQAQDNNTDLRERFMFGLKIGANYSNVYDSQGEAFVADPKLGLAAGAFVAIPFGKFLGIQPELLFSQKGFKGRGNILGASYQLTRTSNFIDIPLYLAFKPSEFITLLLGPQFSYITKQTDSFGNATTSIEQEKEFGNSDFRKNILCVSGGIDITMKHMVLGVRAGWDLQNNHVNSASTTPRYKNTWYQATVGYRFYKD